MEPQPTHASLADCRQTTIKPVSEIFPLARGFAVVIVDSDVPTTMTCRNNTSLLPVGTHIVDYTGCHVNGSFASLHDDQTAEVKLILEGHVTKLVMLPEIRLQPFHVVPEIRNLQAEVAQVLADDETVSFWHLGGLGTVIGVLSILFFVHRFVKARAATTITDDPSDIPLQEVKWADVWTAWKASTATAPAPTAV